MKTKPAPRLFAASCLLLLLCTVVSACKPRHDHAHRPGDTHEHAGHVHTAPHGGTIVELGEEMFHLELVHDAVAGTLTAYVLDGHLENFIRITQGSFALSVTLNGRTEEAVFQAIANPATGETVGDTSQFEARAPWLKTEGLRFEGRVRALTIRGRTFNDASVRFPEGHAHAH